MSIDSNELENEYEFETYEQYYGDADQVKRLIDECPECGSKLVFGHFPDYKNLFLQESSRCIECGHVNKKIIHVIN